jgi:multidrug efflux pump subunit AcrB
MLAHLNARFRAEIPEAFTGVFPPPPVAGVGNAGGYRLYVQDRSNAGLDALQEQATVLMMAANQSPALAGHISTFRANVPQLWLEIDRVKAKSMNVPLSNIFGTLQTYLGSTCVNDLSLFGRTYRVTAQADARFRLAPDDIRLLKTRNAGGGMVPLGSVGAVREISGADKVTHLYLARRRSQRRGRTRLQHRRGDGGRRANRARDIAHELYHRVDRDGAPAKARGPQRALHFPALRAHRLPGARRAV